MPERVRLALQTQAAHLSICLPLSPTTAHPLLQAIYLVKKMLVPARWFVNISSPLGQSRWSVHEPVLRFQPSRVRVQPGRCQQPHVNIHSEKRSGWLQCNDDVSYYCIVRPHRSVGQARSDLPPSQLTSACSYHHQFLPAPYFMFSRWHKSRSYCTATLLSDCWFIRTLRAHPFHTRGKSPGMSQLLCLGHTGWNSISTILWSMWRWKWFTLRRGFVSVVIVGIHTSTWRGILDTPNDSQNPPTRTCGSILLLSSEMHLLTDRDSWRHWHEVGGGEMLGFAKGQHLRMHFPRIFSLIKNEG